MLQADHFEQWKKAGQGKFADVPDLKAELRPKIDKVSQDLLVRLASVQDRIADPLFQRAVRSKLVAVFDKIPAPIRDCSLKPILAKSLE